MSSKHQVLGRALVSTIIPVYNRPDILRDAVHSVLEQTYRPIEIILVDDESTDSTPQTITELVDTYPDFIRATRQANGGPGVARETGRQMARGEFIQYLDSDDILLPQKFEKQVAALDENPEAGAAYCWTRYRKIGEPPHPDPWKRSGIVVETMFPTFLDDRWWDTPTPLYRRSVCDAAGPWTDLRLEEDWEYDCRIAALGTRLVHVPDYLVEIRDHGGDRLCRGDAYDPIRLKMRARSHELILQHAERASINASSPHMQQFSRRIFLLSRQCGAAGLADESRRLVNLAMHAYGLPASGYTDLHVYSMLASVFGWRNLGHVSVLIDSLRNRLRLGNG
jgi:glycosyltransferase involved in cell wall biosynthesis